MARMAKCLDYKDVRELYNKEVQKNISFKQKQELQEERDRRKKAKLSCERTPRRKKDWLAWLSCEKRPKRNQEAGTSQGVKRKRQGSESQKGVKRKKKAGTGQKGIKREEEAGTSQEGVKRKRQESRCQEGMKRKQKVGIGQKGVKREPEAGTSEQGAKTKQLAKTRQKKPKRKRQQQRTETRSNIELAGKKQIDVLMNNGDRMLKIKDSSSSSDDSDGREKLDYSDKTQFFPVVEKKQQIHKGGVASLQNIARKCLIELPHLHEFFKGISSHVLDVLGLLCLFNPKQLFEIGKGRKKNEIIVIDKYWENFCMQDHIKIMKTERKANDKEISYRSLFEKESRFYRNEAKKVERSIMLQPEGKRAKKIFFKKLTPPKLPIWKRQVPDVEQTNASDDSECENAFYPSDPDMENDCIGEVSDSSDDSDL